MIKNLFLCLSLVVCFLPFHLTAAPAVKYPIQIVATTAMVADVVRQIAGDKAQVTNLMGEGVDPHLYKPTRDDVAALSKANLVFYNGLFLEGKMIELFDKLAKSGKPVIAVTEKIAPEFLLKHSEYTGHPDPHVWMDVNAWSETTGVIAAALSQYDPANAAFYEKNAASYREALAGLNTYIRTVIASIPKEQRVLLTAHDAFSYFGRAYGIDVRGVQGISTESEAGVQDINNLVDFIVNKKIGAVFVESTIADKNLRALIEGARSRGQKVIIGGSLYSDAMGATGTYEGSYIGMLDHNATLIAIALGGKAPAGGMQGKLKKTQP